jgi:hypothetical protein
MVIAESKPMLWGNVVCTAAVCVVTHQLRVFLLPLLVPLLSIVGQRLGGGGVAMVQHQLVEAAVA